MYQDVECLGESCELIPVLCVDLRRGWCFGAVQFLEKMYWSVDVIRPGKVHMV